MQEPISFDAPPDIVAIITRYDWSITEALSIVRCESRFHADSENGVSWGLWQLNAAVHIDRWPDFFEWWSDAAANTAHAYELYQEQGFAPWSCA